MLTSRDRWIVCQIGARENYSVARALHQKGALANLLTDVWVPKGHVLGSTGGRLKERFHPSLPDTIVWAPNKRAIGREIESRLLGRHGWYDIMHRNAWFQTQVIRRLERISIDGPVTLFAYSYAAADILAYAKSRGWKTVLGQIDPGKIEADMVSELYCSVGQDHEVIPDDYWGNWRLETDLADIVMVNSGWSRDGLIAQGVSEDKIAISPLSFEADTQPADWVQPSQFNKERPLRLLFLGQVTMRKGIDFVLDAIQQLPDVPLQLDVVGPLQFDVPEWSNHDRRITFHGAVARSAVGQFYADADVFLFPTRSDGFGLTQLEAQSFGLPVIASVRCGEVVSDKIDGVILHDLSAKSLAGEIKRLVEHPAELGRLRKNVNLGEHYSLTALAESIMHLFDTKVVKTVGPIAQ